MKREVFNKAFKLQVVDEVEKGELTCKADPYENELAEWMNRTTNCIPTKLPVTYVTGSQFITVILFQDDT